MYFFFSSKAFDGLLQLLKLDVSHNAIRNIASDAFMGLVSMRQLDLSYNFLKKLDNKTNGALDDCLSLERVIHTFRCNLGVFVFFFRFLFIFVILK